MKLYFLDRRLFALFVLCIFYALPSGAQESFGSILGKVTTSDNSPAANVSVVIKSSKLGTATDNEGNFEFSRMKPGEYTVLVSLLGYETLGQTVKVTAGQIVTPVFALQLNSNELQTVIITAGKNKFLVKKSQTVAKLPLTNLENPQAYSSISKELIKEQVTTDFGNLLKNAPGVYKISGNRGINTAGASFYSLRGFRTEVSMIDGIPAQTNGEIDPANVEKVEVMRGPSATLYGAAVTSLGGLINLITKKPQEGFGGEVSYATGSWNMHRATADLYGPLNKKGNLLGRMNLAYQTQNTFQDAGFRKSYFAAPALEYRPSDRFKINLNAEIYTSEFTSPASIFLNRSRQLFARTPEELGFDWDLSYTNNDITMKTPTVNLRAIFQYQISRNWSSQTIVSRNSRKSKGYYQYQFIRKLTTDDSLERNISHQNTLNTTLDVQQNFVGDFKIGKMRNRIVAGFDYVNLRLNNDNSPYIVFDFVDGSLGKNDLNYHKISRAAVDKRLSASSAARTWNYARSSIYSAYVSDVLNITNNLLAMLSVRVDRFTTKGTVDRVTNKVLPASPDYDQTAVSPKFGLVYQLIKERVSVFGNYMNGFVNVAPATQPLPDISGIFKPQQANQIEGGVKVDLFNGRLNLSASYYDIRVDNVIMNQVIKRENVNYTVKVQEGTQYSKGVEFELIANPLSGLNLVAGYTHNNSKLTNAGTDVEGRRPPDAGPSDLVNAWISYGIPKGKLRGLGAGFGGNYVSRFNTVNAATTGIFTFPAYTLLNATVFYETKLFRVGIKLDNLSDEKYYLGQGVVAMQNPRSWIANITYKF